MPKSTSLCNSLVALLYNATAIADVAENDATSPMTNVHMSLHTASLAPASTQATSETAYTNYARQAVPRTVGGWTAPSGGATANAAAIEFPQCGVTGATITTAATGKDISGGGIVWHYGDLNAPIAVSNQIQPRFPIGAVTITEA
jgi:hypothetical protein